MTILLAEDDTAVREMVALLLCQLGFCVLEGADGLQALRTAEDRLDSVDLIVSDIDMPNMCGPDLVETIWRMCPSIPVIYISGTMDEPRALEHVEQHRALVLAKPFSLEKLGYFVNCALRARRLLKPSC